VHVAHRLPRLRPGVGDDPVARLGTAVGHQTLLQRDRVRARDDLAEQAHIGGDERGRRGVVLLRDHQHVGRGLWIDVTEGQHAVGLVDDVGGDLPGDHAAEQAVAHGPDPRHQPRPARPLR
jgi:hypothetical protein